MRAKRAIDSVKLEFRENHPTEARIVSYLRSRQAQGKELKSEVMTAVIAFFETYAIADDPSCSPSDLHDSWIRSLNLLSGQMSSLSACVERKIQVQPESWRRFALVPTGGVIAQSPPTGSIAPLPQAIASSFPSPPPAVNIPVVPDEPLATLKPKEMTPEELQDYLETLPEAEADAYYAALPNDQLTIK
jgi:hypothetical protein